jgi:DNA-binding GntR family transcriptional regulator
MTRKERSAAAHTAPPTLSATSLPKETGTDVAPRTTAWGAYKSITDALRTRLTGDEFPPGSSLPSEAQLCTEYQVSRNTLRRSLDQLAAEGLIVAQPGRGRVVPLAGSDAVVSATPHYRSMATALRAMIESGKLGPGDALPSESALAQQYGVARGTARHALAELEGSGLIDSVHGKGRFVRGR